MSDRDRSQDAGADFDAIAAAAELDEALDQPKRETEGTADEYARMLEGEVEALTALVEAKDAAIDKARAQAESAREEIERSKHRLAADASRDAERRVRKVLLDMLGVLDDLDRALAAAVDAGAKDAVVEGVELVRKSFLARLQAHGVRHRPALGERFDPAIHEGVSLVPAADPDQDGVVVGVLSEGYDIGDQVLRPARVAVGKASH